MADHEEPRRIPFRRTGPADPAYRDQRLHEQRQIADRIAEIDRTQTALSRERAALADRTRALQDELFPRTWDMSGRAPEPHAVAEPLPPVPPGARPVYGRRLRTICLRLLHRVGRCTLRRLHALLHLHGYVVDAPNPVKILADAVGHEHDAGRAIRVARGTYEPARGLRYRPPSGANVDDLVLPYLPELDSSEPEMEIAE